MNIWFFLASLASFGVCLLHLFAGGKEAARPLLATDELNKLAKFTLWYAWHIVTIVLAVMGAMLALAAIDETQIAVGWFALLLALLCVILSLGMIFHFKLKLMQFPQWLLFLSIVIFGGIGVVG